MTMNNKEFTSELAERLGYTIKDTSELMNSLLSSMTQELEDCNSRIRFFWSEKESGTDFNQPGKQTTHAGST